MVTVHSRPPEILSILADPLRWELMAELGRSDRRVGELSAITGKAQNVVSYHLAQLRRAGVVHARRSAADGRDVYYRADLRACRDLLGAAAGALHPSLLLDPRVADTTRPGRRRPRVLFLCTGNSARSVMAQAFTEQRSGGTVRARSAGSHPKVLHPHTVRVLAHRGIDVGGHRPTALTRYRRSEFDRVVTLCDKVREVCPDFPGGPVVAHWSIPDPAAGEGGDRAAHARFEQVADDIEARVELLLGELNALADERNRS